MQRCVFQVKVEACDMQRYVFQVKVEACGVQFHQLIWITCFQTEKILLVSKESRSPKHCQGVPNTANRRDREKDLGKSAVRQCERDVWVLTLQQNQEQSMFFLVTRQKY